MEKQIEIDGLKVAYDESGDPAGNPVIIMHGWGCDHTTVASIASCLSDGMRVINIDLPGHGKTPEPPAVWGVEDFTVLIERLIDRLDLVSPALVGHSFGGRISILMGSRRNVGKIVLVDAAGIKPRRKPGYYIRVYSYKTMKHLLPAILGKRLGKRLLDRYRNRVGSDDYRRSSERMRAIMSRCVNEDLKYAMPDIKAPTLLIWGEEDTATPLSDARIMERLIPDCGLVSFPGCGHYSFLDNRQGFHAVIREFFKNELKKTEKP